MTEKQLKSKDNNSKNSYKGILGEKNRKMNDNDIL
jgi:hypothetical protein